MIEVVSPAMARDADDPVERASLKIANQTPDAQ
jgi:hypothetical protein